MSCCKARRLVSTSPSRAPNQSARSNSLGCASLRRRARSFSSERVRPARLVTSTPLATARATTSSLVGRSAMPCAVSSAVKSTSRSSRAIPCPTWPRSEEHTSELQSHHDLVCRLLLEKKKKKKINKKNKKKKNKTIKHQTI